MEWNVSLEPDSGIIHSVYSGEITKRDVMAATEKALSYATGRGPHRFLTEHKQATSLLSTMDIFDTPDQWEKADLNRLNSLALVIYETEGYENDILFYETVCRNRGWNVRVFDNYQDAHEWLLKQPFA